MRYFFVFTLLLLVILILCEAQRSGSATRNRRRNQQNSQSGNAPSGRRRGGNQRGNQRGGQRRGQTGGRGRGRGRGQSARNVTSSAARRCRKPLERNFRPHHGNGTCQEIRVPMCRGMIGYTHTYLPNIFGHTTQLQVYRSLEPMWSFMDMSCSTNFRRLACGMHLPKCTNGSTTLEMPCRETCFRCKRLCSRRMKQLHSQWPRKFICGKKGRLRRRCDGECIPPKPERRRREQYVNCQRNTMPLCRDVLFREGTLPNMFLQSNKDDIIAEMAQYESLIASNCSQHTAFFICGLYMPYCIRQDLDIPFALPCQDICQAVQSDCQSTYQQLYGLPWSSKFQCHRYPETTNTQFRCVMPSDSQLVPTVDTD